MSIIVDAVWFICLLATIASTVSFLSVISVWRDEFGSIWFNTVIAIWLTCNGFAIYGMNLFTLYTFG